MARTITIYHIADYETPLDLYFPTLAEAKEELKNFTSDKALPMIRREKIVLNRRGICDALSSIPNIT